MKATDIPFTTEPTSIFVLADIDGVIRLRQALPTDVGAVGPAGPAGANGAAGAAGAAGATGATGATGPSGAANSGVYSDPSGGTDYHITNTYSTVTFVNTAPTVTLPVAGTYLVNAVITFDLSAFASFNGTTDHVSAKLRNTTIAADVSGSENFINRVYSGQYQQIVIQTKVTTASANNVISMMGFCSVNLDSFSNPAAVIVAANTTMAYIQTA